ncbi:MAG: hypothetical protein ACMXYM_05285 [Candidatus Woesearchaeota archaeon]
MGLVRRLFRLVPTVAAFSIGYYIGTIDSGNYECVFENSNPPAVYEQVSGLESEVVSYDEFKNSEH